MIFVNFYSWDQDKRDEVIKRRLEKGRMFPKGVKVLGEWGAIGGNKGVIVVEVDDPKLLYQAVLAWSDVLYSDVFLALDTEKDALGLLKGGG